MDESDLALSSYASFVSISHGEDLDGIASQTLVKRLMFERGVMQHELYRVRYDGVKQCLSNLARRLLQNTIFFITDLNLNHMYQADVVDLARSGSNNHVLYIDHHLYTWEKKEELNAIKGITCIAGPDETCATALVQKNFFLNDDHAKFLAKEACLSDLHDTKQSEDNIQLSRVISMKISRDLNHPDIPRIMNVLGKPGFYKDPWLVKEMKLHDDFYKLALLEAIKGARTEKIKNVRIVWGFSDVISTGDLMRELLKHHDADLSLGFNSIGKAAIKSKNPSISAVKISELWDGGGHEDRAAFFWNRKIKNLDSFLKQEFFPRLENFLR